MKHSLVKQNKGTSQTEYTILSSLLVVALIVNIMKHSDTITNLYDTSTQTLISTLSLENTETTANTQNETENSSPPLATTPEGTFPGQEGPIVRISGRVGRVRP